MADLVYRAVMRDLKQKILAHQYPKMKLPDERTLSADYEVSRSTIKRALDVLVQQGIIFKKRGSGTFINPLYLKNQAMFSYEGSNLGITDSFKFDGRKQAIKLLNYQVIPADEEIQQDLFLSEDDFVYRIERLRLIDDQPFMIETGYIPIKINPTLSSSVVEGSIFNYIRRSDEQDRHPFLHDLDRRPVHGKRPKALKLDPHRTSGDHGRGVLFRRWDAL